jgi:hypothetical protein
MPTCWSIWLRQRERASERGKEGAGAARSNVIEVPAASAFVAVHVDSVPPPRTVAPLDVQVRLPNGTRLGRRHACRVMARDCSSWRSSIRP